MEINGMQTRKITCLVFSVMLSACGNDTGADAGGAPALTAATLGEQAIQPAREYLESGPYASADRDRGRQQAFTCRACHTLEAGGAHGVGPNLHGIFGQNAGTRDGFDYSEALRDTDFVWTPRALDAWLREPADFLPGNRMSFIGVSSGDDRRDLIAYLLDATDTESR